MACKTESTQIGGHEYDVTQWPAEKAFIMKFRLAKTFGPAIGSLTAKPKDDATDTEAMGQLLGEAISKVFDTVSPDELFSLLRECVVGVARDGVKLTDATFTQYFSGDDMADVYPIAAFVLKVNYGNLLRGQLVGDLLAKAQTSLK